MTAPGYDPAVAALNDPATPPGTLNEIAAARPDLLAGVAAHPNCYQELADWIAQVSGASATEVEPTPVEDAPMEAEEPPGREHEPSAEVAPEPEIEAGPEIAEEPPAAEPSGAEPPQPRKLPLVALGLVIGLVIGAVGSAFLVLLVLPGLFGSVL